MRIMVLGASGMLGRAFTETAVNSGYECICVSNSCFDSPFIPADLSVSKNVSDLIRKFPSDVVINFVALTSVDRCESDLNGAFLLNTNLPHALAANLPTSSRLLHISTDHLYDGVASSPNSESKTCLTNVYALSKLSGEIHILNKGGVVIRTNFFGPSRDPRKASFSDLVVANLKLSLIHI